MSQKKIGLVDTTFSRVNMGQIAQEKLNQVAIENGWCIEIKRYTVPGFKDLAVKCRLLLEDEACDICMAMGWVGGMPIDTQCGHEASLALGHAQLLAKKHILEVFIHEKEASDHAQLFEIAQHRTSEHAKNALYLLFAPEIMISRAGTGLRQGGPSVGPLIT